MLVQHCVPVGNTSKTKTSRYIYEKLFPMYMAIHSTKQIFKAYKTSLRTYHLHTHKTYIRQKQSRPYQANARHADATNRNTDTKTDSNRFLGRLNRLHGAPTPHQPFEYPCPSIHCDMQQPKSPEHRVSSLATHCNKHRPRSNSMT